MRSFKEQLAEGLDEIRDAAANHTETRARLEDLERADLHRRLVRVEGNWRLAMWLGAVIGVLTLGLFFDLLRGWILGG